MKTKDILNKKFSILVNASGFIYHDELIDYTQSIADLTSIINLGYRYSIKIDELRSMIYHSKEQKAFKEQFPCWFTGGIFPMKQTEDKDISG